jgi:hypothetical protein
MPVQEQYLPVTTNVPTKQQWIEPRRPGGGGGGGGGRGRDGGEFSADEVAKIFLQLSKASSRFFSGENNWLISDKSAGDLLAGTFELLAQATVAGQLPFMAEQMARQAPSQRAESQRQLDQRAGIGRPPVFSEAESKDILKKIRDCLLPDTPK